jgi:hypothetical protein
VADREGLRHVVAAVSQLIDRVHRTAAALLGAVTVVAALGLSGCARDTSGDPTPTPVPLTRPPTVAAPPTDTGAPLPAPTTLVGLMGRLADPNVPGSDKVGLVEYGTAADAAALDRFAKALHDSAYAPVTFDIANLMWAQDQPGNVIADVTIKSANPQASKDLKFPMEFAPQQDSWQLTRKTTDLLLQLGQKPTGTPGTPAGTPTATPTGAPTVTPGTPTGAPTVTPTG